MFISWRWISEWVDTSGVDAKAFCERFTTSVAEIDGAAAVGEGLDDVLVARVLEVRDHPNADKLHIATVDLGTRTVEVVCGAPDISAGQIVPFVAPGVKLPSGIEVRDAEVRGVRSPGMLASERDLGLSDDHAGLWQLDGLGASPGTPLVDTPLGLRDVLYEVDNKSITHRPDLWGHYGIAREIAALLDRPLAPLDTQVLWGGGEPVIAAVEAPDLCPRYCCARIEDVRVLSSPVAVRLRLRRLGVRPISNVVDATNLVMLETGNPLHAFDARFLVGDRIVVRRAGDGEVLRTLDGQNRALAQADCVIADGERAVALAGIMGGEHSEIRDDTTTVVLESANFFAPNIRKTATRLGMRTESSARFEKALDPHLAKIAAERFLNLCVALSPGARVASPLTDAGPFGARPWVRPRIATSIGYIRERLGTPAQSLPDARIEAILRSLDFDVRTGSNGELDAGVPSHRATRDIAIPEDLVEEVGRQFGYGNIAPEPPETPIAPPWFPPARQAERDLRALAIRGAGLSEVVLYAFESEAFLARAGLRAEPRLRLRNRISTDLPALRRSLVPNLVHCAERNLGQGADRVRIFEFGRAFVPLSAGDAGDFGIPEDLRAELLGDGGPLTALLPDGTLDGLRGAAARNDPLPRQGVRFGVVLAERVGSVARRTEAYARRLFDELRGLADACARTLDRVPLEAVPRAAGADPWVHPARSALLRCGDADVGFVTLLHPGARNALEMPCEMGVLELELDALLAAPARRVLGEAPPRFPGTSLDLTLDVSPAVTHAEVLGSLTRAALSAAAEDKDVLVQVAFVTRWDAPDGARRLTYRLHLRSPERTLDDAAIQRLVAATLAAFRAGAPAGVTLPAPATHPEA